MTRKIERMDDCYSTRPSAEIQALRAEAVKLKNLRADAIHECALANVRAERLAEALHKLEEACDDSDGAQYGTLGTAFVRGICKDALRREQEK